MTKMREDAIKTQENLQKNTVDLFNSTRDKTVANAREMRDTTVAGALEMRDTTVKQAKSIAGNTVAHAGKKAEEIKELIDDNVIIPLSSSIGTILSRFKISPFERLASREQYLEFAGGLNTFEITITPRSEYTQVVMVPAGKKIDYGFVIKDLDLKFGVRLRTMSDEGAVEEEIISFKKFRPGAGHEGSIMAGDFDKQFVLCFDNKYSILSSKALLFRMECKEDDLRAKSPNLDFLDKGSSGNYGQKDTEFAVGTLVSTLYGNGEIVDRRGKVFTVKLHTWKLANNSDVMCFLGEEGLNIWEK